MSDAIITYPGATTPITPIHVNGYESSRESGVVIHPIVGRSSPDVTLAPAALRAGTLNLLFDDETESRAAEDAHALPLAFTLVSAARTTIDMYYVVTGATRRTLNSVDRRHWVVEVPFQEVSP